MLGLKEFIAKKKIKLKEVYICMTEILIYEEKK